MQADLQHLIVGVLREYPSLSYFQVGCCINVELTARGSTTSCRSCISPTYLFLNRPDHGVLLVTEFSGSGARNP